MKGDHEKHQRRRERWRVHRSIGVLSNQLGGATYGFDISGPSRGSVVMEQELDVSWSLLCVSFAQAPSQHHSPSDEKTVALPWQLRSRRLRTNVRTEAPRERGRGGRATGKREWDAHDLGVGSKKGMGRQEQEQEQAVKRFKRLLPLSAQWPPSGV